ncbi:uncharacterized protein LOC134533196 [Bacillus rossius redtenbacheri]|uniref:uncharacterized protein LOC134533196 n=1 Tax=Bacillus rossius redtenbacheri TaxID=93214 RepID=UPI002FDEC82F
MRRILRVCAFVIIDVLFAELCTCMPTPQFYSGSPVVEHPGAASPRVSGGAGVSTELLAPGCPVHTARTLVSDPGRLVVRRADLEPKVVPARADQGSTTVHVHRTPVP